MAFLDKYTICFVKGAAPQNGKASVLLVSLPADFTTTT